MDREEFKTLVKAMKSIYAEPKFIADQNAFNLWYSLLRDLPYNVASAAVQRHMMSNKFPPMPSDIREIAQQITAPVEDDMGELEAWSLVYKAICSLSWDAPEKEFDKLPDLCKQAIGNAANLREMAQMDTNTVESVEQSHFLRAYRAAKQQRQKESALSLGLRQQIDAIRISTGAYRARIEG
ncbi:MAG: hypothetical protein IJ680_06695 [Paludibacteraceae bacterium]|nr:hypothetical protein [Paludibacteraceae bacterium]